MPMPMGCAHMISRLTKRLLLGIEYLNGYQSIGSH
jgi:hypothetical protein